MVGRVHLVRHAEGLHNLSNNDPNIPDAPLSQRGFDFAEDLGRRFVNANSNRVGIVMSSPLRRAIQTSLTAFPRILHIDNYPENSWWGSRTGVELVLDADLQEITDLPCNTGSPVSDLEQEFPSLSRQIQQLDPNWYSKTGLLSPLPPAVEQRKRRILERLQQTLQVLGNQRWRTDIVLVTHEGVIGVLAPNATIPVGQFQSFSLVRGTNGQLSLV